MAPPRRPIVTRLMERVSASDDGCWLWSGARFRDGYGKIQIGRNGTFRAHRIAYGAFVGPIPKGVLVCHKCDTPLCINPDHLFLGTPKDNTQDMLSKGRRNAPSGIDHPSAKLTDSQVEQIRSLRIDGWKLQEIADKFSCSFQHVSALSRGIYRAK